MSRKKKNSTAWHNRHAVYGATNEILQAKQGLETLMAELTPQELAKAMRNTLAKEARAVAKPARQALKSATFGGKPLKNAAVMARGIRAKARKDLQGYVVSVAFKTMQYGFYQNGQHGKWGKPVLYWLNAGTKERSTGRIRWMNQAKLNRGKIEGANFMSASLARRDQSVEKIKEDLIYQCNRIIDNFSKNW